MTNSVEVSVRHEKANRRAVWALIWICWLAYSCSYLGKVNYSANITQIEGFYNVSHADAGWATTLLFISYGVGQFVNGFLCKKYNIRWMIFLSLLSSGIINLLVAITTSFAVVQWLWFFNGVALSVLWATVIRLLSENLSRRDMAKASVVMGTTVASGTLLIYGFSALFVALDVFKMAFVLAGIVMPTVAFVWLFALPKIVKKAKAASEEYEEQDRAVAQASQARTKDISKSALKLMIVVLAVVAIAINLINDGLKSWMPAILEEGYGLDSSVSIILTLVLPLMAIFSNMFAVNVHKLIPDFVLQCAAAFGISGLMLAAVIGAFSLNQFIITIIGCAATCFLVASCNSLITSIFPLFMKDKVNSGKIAGVLNGFCYVGSSISTVGLGALADNSGWTAVFWLLFGICSFIVLIAIVYLMVKKFLVRER